MTGAIAGTAQGAERLPVRTPEGEYDIVMGRGLLAAAGALATDAQLGRRVVVATDANVAPLYGSKTISALESSGFVPSLAVMPAGEQNKTMASVELFIEAFLSAGLDRSGWVAALGGGVVGDTAGFAASIFMRGLPLVQLPSTLLAMCDSSIGGKVGVDHPRGKNLLGAFKQPYLVIADLDTLGTLPAEQVACGMAEIIKAGIIGDPELFSLCAGGDNGPFPFEVALRRAVLVKRRVVEADPYEHGERAWLNLGHTFGHAFEKCSGYRRLHGFAVAQGMVVACRVSELIGLCGPQLGEELAAALVRWSLPVRWGAADLAGSGTVAEVMAAMGSDKKRRDGKLRFVLPEATGKVRLVDNVDESAIRRALVEMQ